MIIYHILVMSPEARVMHESYYTDHAVIVETAKWWIHKAKMHVETWVSYGNE